jgi:hypothetical protein
MILYYVTRPQHLYKVCVYMLTITKTARLRTSDILYMSNLKQWKCALAEMYAFGYVIKLHIN